MIKRLAIIPARSGSKRIKNKNIKDFLGTAIILRVLKEIKKSNLFDVIHVSTDSRKIKKIIENKKFTVDFLRPKNLADEKTVIMEVVAYVLEKYKKLSSNFDEVWIVYPTAVLVESCDLKKASKYLIQNKIKSIMAVSKFQAPIEWSHYIKDNKLFPLNKKKLEKPSSKFREYYYDTGTFFALNLNKIKLNQFKNLPPYTPFILPPFKAVDVDTIDDWNLAIQYFKFSNR